MDSIDPIFVFKQHFDKSDADAIISSIIHHKIIWKRLRDEKFTNSLINAFGKQKDNWTAARICLFASGMDFHALEDPQVIKKYIFENENPVNNHSNCINDPEWDKKDISIEQISEVAKQIILEKQLHHTWNEYLDHVKIDLINGDSISSKWGTVFSLVFFFEENKKELLVGITDSINPGAKSLLAFILSSNNDLFEKYSVDISDWVASLTPTELIEILVNMNVYENKKSVSALADLYLKNKSLKDANEKKAASMEMLLNKISLNRNYALIYKYSGNPNLAQKCSDEAYKSAERLNHTLAVLKDQVDPANSLVSPVEHDSVESAGILTEPLRKILHAVEIKESDRDSARKLCIQIYQEIIRAGNIKTFLFYNDYGLAIKPEQIVILYIDVGLIEEAAEISERLIEFQPLDLELLKISALLRYQYGDYQKAAEYYSHLEITRDLSREEKLHLAESLEYMNSWSNALEVRKNINPVSLEDHQNLAICTYRSGDQACFESVSKTANEAFSDDGLFQVLRALFFQKQGETEHAQTIIDSVLSNSTNDAKALELILEYYLRTTAPEQTANSLDLKFALEKDTPGICLSLCELKYRQADISGCKKILGHLSRQNNFSELSTIEKSIQWCLDLGEMEYARSIIGQYADQWVLSPILAGYRARLLIEAKDFKSANAILKRLVNREEKQEEWLINFGLSLLECTRRDFPLKNSEKDNISLADIGEEVLSIFSQFPDNLILKILVAGLDMDNSQEHYRDILTTEKYHNHPEVWRVYAGMGQNYFRLKKYDLAVVNLREAQKSQPENKIINLFLIKAYTQMRLFDDALRIFTTSLNIRELELTDLLEVQNNLKTSDQWERVLAGMLEKDPQNNPLQITLAKLYIEKGKITEALAIIQKLQFTNESNRRDYMMYVQLLIDADHLDEAKRILEIFLSAEENLTIQEYLSGAFLYDQLNENHKAANLLNLIKQTNYAVQAYKSELFQKLGLIQEAIDALQLAINDFESNAMDHKIQPCEWVNTPVVWQKYSEDPSSIYLTLIEIMVSKKELQNALTEAQKGIEAFPNHTCLKSHALNLAYILGNDEIVEELFESVPANLADEPTGDEACVWGEIALNKNEEIFAANLISQWLKDNPDSPRVKALQARLLARNGNSDEAQQIFNELLRNTKNDEEKKVKSIESYQFWLANAAFDLKQYQPAINICEKIFNDTGMTIPAVKIFLDSFLKVAYEKWINEKLMVCDHSHAISAEDHKYFDDICILTEKKIKEDQKIQNTITAIKVWLNQNENDHRDALGLEQTGQASYALIAAQYYLEGSEKAEITLEKYKQDSQAKFLFAILDMHNNSGRALAYLTQAMRESVTQPQQYAALAFIKKEQGQIEDAYAAINLALAEWPEEYKWQIMAGELSQKLGDIHTSLDHFRKAAEIHQDDDIQGYLGELNLKAGNQMGITFLEHKLVGEPQDFETLIELGELSLRNEKFQKAAKYLEQARHFNPLDPRSYVLMSRIAMKVNNLPKAEQIIEQAYLNNSSEISVILQKAEVIHKKIGAKTALEFIEKAGNLEIDGNEEIILQKAELIAELDGDAKALEYLLDQQGTEKCTKINLTAANLHLKLGNITQAENLAEFALQNDSENPDSLGLLARIGKQSGDLDKAIDYLIKAIQINPFEADFYIEMARIYQSRRDLKNAAVILESGLRANPLNFDLLSSLGLLYYKQGIYDRSEEYLRQAAAIKPHNENVKRLLSTLLNANIIHANSEVDLVTDEVQ